MYVRGKGVSNPHPAIVLFTMVETMRWNHLPAGGGIGEQDPMLWDKFRYIISKRNEHDSKERKSQERKKNNPARPPRRNRGR